MGWFTLGAALIGGLASSNSARQNREAAEAGSSQETDLTTDVTLPPWLQSFIEDNLMARLGAVPEGPLYQQIDPRIGYVERDPYSVNAADQLQNYINGGFFQNGMQSGMGTIQNLMGGQNPLLSQGLSMQNMGNQAFGGLMGLAQNNPMLDPNGVLMQNLQQIFQSGFGGGGGMGGGGGGQQRGGIPYNELSAMYSPQANGAPHPAMNSAYLDMMQSGRDDGFTPYGFTGTNSPRIPLMNGGGGPSGTAALLGRRG